MDFKMLVSATPFHSLRLMLDKLNLDDSDRILLGAHRGIFVSRSEEFADYFYDSFAAIPDTRVLLERFGRPEHIKRTWAAWFSRLFTEDLEPEFVSYLWGVGIKHVEINLDQRFSNLGFSFVRRFCHGVTLDSFPTDTALKVMAVVDKLVDFCILVETNAYIEATVRCDMEILKGIADKIRNPVMVIGGNLRRFQRRTSASDPMHGEYGFLISYTSHCEDMIADINTYMEVFQHETRLDKCMIATVIDDVLEKLANRKRLEGVKLEISLSAEAKLAVGDPADLRHLFYHIIENAAEASRLDKTPAVRISSAPQEAPPNTVRIEVFNNGEVINMENIAKILSPFYSTKAQGSGLGLSIAKLIVRKNLGEMNFEPVYKEGTKVIVTLQRARLE